VALSSLNNETRRDAAYRDQPSLFDAPVQSVVPVDNGKASRDETYREVRQHHDSDRMIWLCRIVAKGLEGATLDELATEYGVEASSFSGRITELKDRGLVVRTGERRQTRKGSTAAVIVATKLFPSDNAPRCSSSTHAGEPMTTATSYMPDQLTCTSTPVDQHGDAIQDGRMYMINNARVQCFESEGSLYVQKIVRRDVPVDGSRPQLVGELPAAVKIERV
jgi:hypothetical protein